MGLPLLMPEFTLFTLRVAEGSAVEGASASRSAFGTPVESTGLQKPETRLRGEEPLRIPFSHFRGGLKPPAGAAGSPRHLAACGMAALANPLESVVTKNAPVTPLQSALTKSLDLKSFRFRSYKKRWVGGYLVHSVLLAGAQSTMQRSTSSKKTIGHPHRNRRDISAGRPGGLASRRA